MSTQTNAKEKVRDPAARGTDPAEDRTDMALARTVMAADRTLMGWVRTCLSMLTFGFTIYKFLIFLQDTPGKSRPVNPEGPMQLGLTIIGLGILSMLLGLIDYYSFFKRFGKSSHQNLWGSSFVIGVLILLLGLALVTGVIMKAI